MQCLLIAEMNLFPERGLDMKKLFTMLMSVVLLATMVVGGTLAQELLTIDFNNSEKQAVLIEQRVDVSELIPPYSDYTVSVTNKSNDKVYVRTLFAFEVLKGGTEPYLNLDTTNIQSVTEQTGDENPKQVRITVDEKQYDVYECYYPLEQNETHACLEGFCFNTTVNNTDFKDEQYCIMAYSQALMAENEVERNQIADCEKMKELFGAVTSRNHPWLPFSESTEESLNTQTNIDVE